MTSTYHNKDEEMEFECDQCGHTVIYFGTFYDCIEDTKNDDWISVPVADGEWEHYCSKDCQLAAMF